LWDSLIADCVIPTEDNLVGEDTGSPIMEDTYAVPFRSNGLKRHTVKVDHGK